MRSEDYTADSICQAMGLPGFTEHNWTKSERPALRMVLEPSFHPEVCITLTSESDRAEISVISLTEQFWARGPNVRLSSESETAAVSRTTFEEMVELAMKAHASLDPQKRHVCLDGMSIESCLVSEQCSVRFRVHCSVNPSIELLAVRLVEAAWNTVQQPRIRNGLAVAASYLGVKYPPMEVPSSPPISRLLVLGTQEGRADYFEWLRQIKKAGD